MCPVVLVPTPARCCPASAGPAAWRAVTVAYAARLEAQQEPHLAALHLLAAQEVEAAVKASRGRRLFSPRVDV